MLQEKVYRSRIANVDELKTRLIDEWALFDQSIVDAAIGQWRRRLSACVRVSGAHLIVMTDLFKSVRIGARNVPRLHGHKRLDGDKI